MKILDCHLPLRAMQPQKQSLEAIRQRERLEMTGRKDKREEEREAKASQKAKTRLKLQLTYKPRFGGVT